MKRIVILSDTHGLLRPEVLNYLSQADVIVHGGDINTQAIVNKLQGFAPLHIVRGNNDKAWARGAYSRKKMPCAFIAHIQRPLQMKH